MCDDKWIPNVFSENESVLRLGGYGVRVLECAGFCLFFFQPPEWESLREKTECDFAVEERVVSDQSLCMYGVECTGRI